MCLKSISICTDKQTHQGNNEVDNIKKLLMTTNSHENKSDSNLKGKWAARINAELTN